MFVELIPRHFWKIALICILVYEQKLLWEFSLYGKGRKDRVLYLSKDARFALDTYLTRRSSKTKYMFLVQKGPLAGTPISVRGIQKRIEYYARESKIRMSCLGH
jgi:site-specific recombinase XerC